MSIGAKNGVETPPAPYKTQWWTEKKSCKTMKQDENDRNYERESTPVVGNKPNGKSRMNTIKVAGYPIGAILPRRVFWRTAIISSAICVFSLAVKAQGVLDGGFESVAAGNYTNSLGDGWTVAQGDIFIFATLGGQSLGAVAYSGAQAADLDTGYDGNTLSQTISVGAGQSYILSYWVADTSPDLLIVTFGGTVVFDGVSPVEGVTSPSDYVQYQFTVTPSTSSAVLSFTGQYTGGGTGSLGTILDDVSLTQVPEPSSLALLTLGILTTFGKKIVDKRGS
jgi:hypothetical protein